MPTYVFKCNSCGKEFSKLMSMTDTTIPKCIKCNSTDIMKLISGGSGVHYKGSGFYTTDYPKSN